MAKLPVGGLMFGMGDGNHERIDAQRLNSHLGKFLRIQPDGRVPADNPFVNREGALPEIDTIGHRNPQGVVMVNGVPYAHKHGARGGDELNRLAPGANYGWPLTTGGVDYTYALITPYRSLPGITDPLTEWTPSIAPAGLAWYDGALFSAWRGSLLVAALAERSVRRVPMVNGTPGAQELLFKGTGQTPARQRAWGRMAWSIC